MVHTAHYSSIKIAFVGAGLAGLLALFSGCSMSPPKFMMDIQQGETFELKQPLSMAGGQARIYIQHGQVTGSGFDRFEPHCRLETRDLNPQGATIQPDSFAISKVRIGEEAVANQSKHQTDRIYASLLVGQAMANDSDNDSNRVPTMDLVHLYLHSEKQPDVLRLTCAGSLSDGDPFDEPRSHRPERNKINQILGNIGQIRQ